MAYKLLYNDKDGNPVYGSTLNLNVPSPMFNPSQEWIDAADDGDWCGSNKGNTKMSLDLSLVIYADTGDGSLFRVEVYEDNYTHNVSPMWRLAGVYDILYKSQHDTAGSCIETLQKGLAHMRDPVNREAYEALNPSNGWGSFMGAREFLEKFTNACIKHPKCIVESWA